MTTFNHLHVCAEVDSIKCQNIAALGARHNQSDVVVQWVLPQRDASERSALRRLSVREERRPHTDRSVEAVLEKSVYAAGTRKVDDLWASGVTPAFDLIAAGELDGGDLRAWRHVAGVRLPLCANLHQEESNSKVRFGTEKERSLQKTFYSIHIIQTVNKLHTAGMACNNTSIPSFMMLKLTQSISRRKKGLLAQLLFFREILVLASIGSQRRLPTQTFE